MKDGAPALGWVERVWREGNVLLADFASIPQLLFDAVKDGLYRHVSVELLHKVKADTREIPWVLDAVSLLGATQPAVGILKDLQSLTLGRRPALQGGARLVFKRAFSKQSSEVKGMDEKEVKALIDAAVGAVTVKFSKEIDTVKQAAADQVAAAQAETNKLKLSSHRSEINAHFETAIKADTLEPKHRETFSRMAGVADDARVLSVKLEDVDAFIKDNAKAPSKKLTRSTTEQGETDADEAGLEMAADVVAHRVNKLALSRNIKDSDVEARIKLGAEVLKKDPKLALAYRDHAEAPVADAA